MLSDLFWENVLARIPKVSSPFFSNRDLQRATEKLSKSIFIALKKRPIDTETIDKMVSKISRNLEEMGHAEITSNIIGKMVMEELKELDPVGYVRFASVYRNFREVKDFEQFVDKLDVYKKT